MSANRRFRRVVRIGPVQVATYYDGRGRERPHVLDPLRRHPQGHDGPCWAVLREGRADL